MILYICLSIILNNYVCQTGGQTIKIGPVENVYIDTLVQRYLSAEKMLWDYIYLNSSDRSVDDLLTKIQFSHHDILSDRYLDFVMSDTYVAQFIKYIDFKNMPTYVEGYQRMNLNYLESNAYMTLERTFINNYTSPEMLFGVIEKDSINSSCKNWSTEIGSTNQNLFMFYEILSANLLTSYMKSQRFNMLQVIKNGFELHNFERLRMGFNLMYNRTANVAKEYLRTTTRRTWMCDRNATADKGTSMEITNFLQGYVDNEINLNPDGSCWNTCSDYKFTKNYGCSNGTFCYEQMKNVGVQNPTCNGTIIDCDFIDSELEICPSVSNSNRRYEYINYGCTFEDRLNKTKCNEAGRHFGRRVNCETRPTMVKSFKKYLVSKCDYCFCYCDEQNIDSDRYFSLQPVVTDTNENMIVSGVAIIKRNGIFSWTITQSKLLGHGRVQQHNYNARKYFLFKDFQRTDYEIVDGVDYHTLSWQNRSINLDIIILPPGCVVTGVRFIVREEALSLQVRSTRFDFNTGTLLDDNEWVSNYNTVGRSNLQLNRPEPIRYYDIYGAYMTVPDFTPNKFIKFRPSDPDKDAGQSTVPFVDSQMVRPKNLTPLSGIGIYYKGKPGLGGYVAPTVVGYDMSPYIGNR